MSKVVIASNDELQDIALKTPFWYKVVVVLVILTDPKLTFSKNLHLSIW